MVMKLIKNDYSEASHVQVLYDGKPVKFLNVTIEIPEPATEKAVQQKIPMTDPAEKPKKGEKL